MESVFRGKTTLVLVVTALLTPVTSRADSLWQRRSPRSRDSLFTDDKAHRAGDLITILIQEESAIESTEDLDKEKENKIFLELAQLVWPAKGERWARFQNNKPKLDVTASRENSGTGRYESSRSVVRRVTATVREVLANGNMLIEARRQVTANGEKQTVVFSGVVRATDVSASNTVLSEYVSDVNLEIHSKGLISQVRIRGWLSKIVDAVWPF